MHRSLLRTALAIVAVMTLALTGCAPGIEGQQPNKNPTVFPSPDDPNYNPFAKIGNKSNVAIADVDQLKGYFTSPEVTRGALIAALSQASQQEVDRIFEVMGDYDYTNDTEVTKILNKYGLNTNEIPINPMGRISELNDFTIHEVSNVADSHYADIPYDSILNALAKFSQDEIDTTRGVMNGQVSIVTLNNLLRSHGVTLGDGYLK
ncbi:MAG: hypothetical protein J0H56_00880 [Micrococcales bacterium]|nr:hypothetical protein [Micrococcales bacterium]